MEVCPFLQPVCVIFRVVMPTRLPFLSSQSQYFVLPLIEFLLLRASREKKFIWISDSGNGTPPLGVQTMDFGLGSGVEPGVLCGLYGRWTGTVEREVWEGGGGY